MGRGLTLYPTQITEEELFAGRDSLCFTVLYCDRSSGEFLRQCGVYWDAWDGENIPEVLQTKPCPDTAYIFMADQDGRVKHDRIRKLHYCTAGEFHKINPDLCDNSIMNKAALAYCCALPPEIVVIVYIS